MNISYDYYRIFYYVAACGSFTKAAESLGNSQPNITRAMNNLEAQTGLKLFARNKKGVLLTPEGKQLYEHVKVAFYHLTQAEEEMEKESAFLGGNVVIGVSEIALHEVLLSRLISFHKKYPGVKIQLTNQSTPDTIETLKKGMVNFALVTTPFEIRLPLESKKIRDFEEVLVASQSFSELKGRCVPMQDLEQYPWISLLPGTATRRYYDQFFSSHEIHYEPQFLAATTDQILPMIKAGLGIGFVPVGMLAQREEEVFCVKTNVMPQARSVHLITNHDHVLSAAALQLMDMILHE